MLGTKEKLDEYTTSMAKPIDVYSFFLGKHRHLGNYPSFIAKFQGIRDVAPAVPNVCNTAQSAGQRK
jgi:hypothetical protein